MVHPKSWWRSFTSLRVSLGTGLFLLLNAAMGSTLAGQQVYARVLDSLGVMPLAGAIALIETRTGDLVARRLTGEDGRVSFSSIEPGRYVLRIEMIGRATKELSFEMSARDQSIRREVRLAARPIQIEGVSVAAGERCSLAPDAGVLVRQVWEEARKALAVTAATDREGLYRYETVLYERDLDREMAHVEGMREERRARDLAAPFVTRPTEELLSRGFVERSDGSDVYFGPDAHLLLSDAFLATHCLTIAGDRASGAPDQVVGLSFRPVTAVGERVDIAGTLWLDLETSELRHLDYQYTNLPVERSDPRVGGRVEFKRMPQGGWIVSAWWIRTPSMSVQWDREYRTRDFLSGFRESGGAVVEARWQGESVLRGTTLGTLTGTVQSGEGEPLSSVRVDLTGTARTVSTGADGRFSFPDLPEGFYQLLAADARSISYGLDPTLLGVRVDRGQSANVLLTFDPDHSLRNQCRSSIPARPASAPSGPWPPGQAVLITKVVDDEGFPVEGALVNVGWALYSFDVVIAQPSGRTVLKRPSVTTPHVPVTATVGEEGFGYEGRTDGSGIVRFCGVKEGERLFVTVRTRGEDAEVSKETRIEDFAGVREVLLTLPPSEGR
jgi:Carboxypeptidase regulatory-like domain